MPIEVKYKFNETFKRIFLDIWYEWSKPSFTTALEACDKVGNDMIIWLRDTEPKLFEKAYKQALKETGEDIVSGRFD